MKLVLYRPARAVNGRRIKIMSRQISSLFFTLPILHESLCSDEVRRIDVGDTLQREGNSSECVKAGAYELHEHDLACRCVSYSPLTGPQKSIIW